KSRQGQLRVCRERQRWSSGNGVVVAACRREADTCAVPRCGPAMNDAVAGHVDLLVGSTALSMPQVEAGSIRAIVQTGKERNQFIAQVPTVAESGFPGFEAYAWWGIFAPAGTPKPIIDRFGNEMAATLREERIAKQLVETQQVSLTLGGPEAER